jgi:hypothetical protein
MNFVPQLEHRAQAVPFFEDQKDAKSGVRGWRAEAALTTYINGISQALGDLDAAAVIFTPGQYPGESVRFGYRVAFQFRGVPGRIDCAALPLRKYTDTKKEHALAQALYLLKSELEALASAWIYKPGSLPLIPYLLGPGGQTVTEALIESGVLPELRPAGFLQAGGR